MAGLIDWTIAAGVGGLALLALLIAIRGRKIDDLPRCKRRRCRYDLTAILGEERPGRAYPATCSECGRVMDSERDVRWGRRRARKWLLAPSLVVILACAGLGGFEIYARATNLNPLTVLPLWVLENRATHDSPVNGYVHHAELLRRANAGEISARAADELVEQILRWQTDESIYWGLLGDVFASLAMRGHATEAEVKQFWDNVWILRVHIRDTAVEGEWVAVEVRGDWRGHKKQPLMLAGTTPISLPTVASAWHKTVYFTLSGDITIEREGAPALRLRVDPEMNIPTLLTWASGPAEYVWIPGQRPVLLPDEKARSTFEAGRAGTSASVVVTCRVAILDLNRLRHAPSKELMEIQLEQRGFRTSWDIAATRELVAVAPTHAPIRLVASDAMRKRLEGNLVAESFEFNGMTSALTVRMFPSTQSPYSTMPIETPLEATLAHRVYLRLHDGTEMKTDTTIFSTTDLIVDSVDLLQYESAIFADDAKLPVVILRPDPVAARSVTGIDAIWDGVLEIPITRGVYFSRPSPNSDGAQSSDSSPAPTP
ncbi:MAG: hypothetical protein ACTS27_07890 [Phycisphaerales bacterium]